MSINVTAAKAARKTNDMKNQKTAIEKKFAQWKEYGEQFTEKEKASYINGYKRAIQDIIRLARGGKEARLVRSWVMRDTMRAVVEASVKCGMDAAESRYADCRRYCECYDPDLDHVCAAEYVYCPPVEDCCSVKKGVPSFNKILETIQTESINTHRQ